MSIHSRHGLLLAAFSACFGCREVSCPVPPQRSAPVYHLSAVLDMNRANTSWPGAAILRGVLPDPENLSWRWTGPRAAFCFPLDAAGNWQFEARITAIQAVLSRTGPQTARFLVNGRCMKTLRLDHAESYDFRIPVPAGLLAEPATTLVELHTNPCLPQFGASPDCVVLHRIGFSRDLP